MASIATYTVIGIRAGDTKLARTKFEGSPSVGQIAQRFRKNLNNRIYDMAVRYYPSKRGWRIIDLRNAFVTTGHRKIRSFWTGIKTLPFVYPNEDAAIMAAMHKLAAPTAQQELAL